MTKITKLVAALFYISRNWPVFPVYEPDGRGGCSCGNPKCPNPAKHPRTSHGVLDATTNEARIRAWWTQWPEANIGFATGQQSGAIVLDVDPRHGGDESMSQVEAMGDTPIKTMESLTGGGGRHLFFGHPGTPVKNRIGILPGLDVRGDGGYVLVPPSVHISGREYIWKKKS